MQQILGHFVVQENQWWILIDFCSLIPNPGFILRFDEPIFPLGLFHVILGLFLIIFWNFCEKWRRIILLNLNERRQYYNDNSGNIICKITCNGCYEYYIGVTVNLRHRVSSHKFNLFNRAYREQKVHVHIHECAGHLTQPFTIIPFYKVKNDTVIARLATEAYFIRKFKPLLNDDCGLI